MDSFDEETPGLKIELTEREMAIARAAAKLAVEEISDEFYRRLGKTFVSRVLWLIGATLAGFAFSKGWIKLNL